MICHTMSYPLTLTAILQRAETLFGSAEIVSELPDHTPNSYTYRDMVEYFLSRSSS